MSTGIGPLCPSKPEVWSWPVPEKPKVLIISERSREREGIPVLVGTMGSQWTLAPSVEDALSELEGEKPSAAVLDLPDGVFDPWKMSHNFPELLARMRGRLVVLTDECA